MRNAEMNFFADKKARVQNKAAPKARLFRLVSISLYIIREKPLFLNAKSRKTGEKSGYLLSRILEIF
ncbi:MAG: hypothetical protein A3C93_00260 [Candidatus Lloydbacteria bacterium RIFCSPHIGHO2_02_FULL_54_17]|uniref:Uncharacterized protein n=1 Tax=Candidatus Lloydbacteria bacterium RIFCSPHIGHO2_02_FULL_54_17 TaxID=1798664 RepID=A0A1G2DIA4_9BACT|nr:MAG: hypothetical protein A2762_06335 [Candidatus Lloydbacteria bacterium RIFCSPHIGHO2_01_FULL_54_11]OGZ12548.1 MAG: hypothetical protein A3C93_00260 [Candidatus Lloydbacteria bacterium RIFCSPHIGHO2_02_FULL_54_17]OGZ14625.1 MAG: hypothetical protein A2948_02320 [Candidatus Lloydbacteria bacterium RIFCSPLOWO2_01_FULL_54_18]